MAGGAQLAAAGWHSFRVFTLAGRALQEFTRIGTAFHADVLVRDSQAHRNTGNNAARAAGQRDPFRDLHA